jgi:NhaP-type Na+/H+ and K+/H+ antiporter
MYRYLGVLQKVFGAQYQPFDSFMLNGGSTLQSLAHFYGLNLPVADPKLSVAEYLARRAYGQPQVGDRAVLDGRIELIVREIVDGRIQTVCLRILGNRPERRGPWRYEGEHNFMRRAADRERDRRANSIYQRRFNGLRRSTD